MLSRHHGVRCIHYFYKIILSRPANSRVFVKFYHCFITKLVSSAILIGMNEVSVYLCSGAVKINITSHTFYGSMLFTVRVKSKFIAKYAVYLPLIHVRKYDFPEILYLFTMFQLHLFWCPSRSGAQRLVIFFDSKEYGERGQKKRVNK